MWLFEIIDRLSDVGGRKVSDGVMAVVMVFEQDALRLICGCSLHCDRSL